MLTKTKKQMPPKSRRIKVWGSGYENRTTVSWSLGYYKEEYYWIHFSRRLETAAHTLLAMSASFKQLLQPRD
jgi:hypothetical protein